MGQFSSSTRNTESPLSPLVSGNTNLRYLSLPFIGKEKDCQSLQRRWLRKDYANDFVFPNACMMMIYFLHKDDFDPTQLPPCKDGFIWFDADNAEYQVPVMTIPKENKSIKNMDDKTILKYNVIWYYSSEQSTKLLTNFKTNHSFVNFVHFPQLCSPTLTHTFLYGSTRPLLFVCLIDYSDITTLELLYGQVIIPMLTYLSQYGYFHSLWAPFQEFPIAIVVKQSPIDQHVFTETTLIQLFEFLGLKNTTIFQDNDNIAQNLDLFYYDVFFNQFNPFSFNKETTPAQSTFQDNSLDNIPRYTTCSDSTNPNTKHLNNFPHEKAMIKTQNFWWYQDFFRHRHKNFSPIQTFHPTNPNNSPTFFTASITSIQSRRESLVSSHPFFHHYYNPYLTLPLSGLLTHLRSQTPPSPLDNSPHPNPFPTTLQPGFPRGNYNDVLNIKLRRPVHDEPQPNSNLYEKYYVPSLSLSSRVYFFTSRINPPQKLNVPEQIDWMKWNQIKLLQMLSMGPKEYPSPEKYSPYPIESLEFQKLCNPHHEFPHYLDQFIDVYHVFYLNQCRKHASALLTSGPDDERLFPDINQLEAAMKPSTLHEAAIWNYSYQTAIVPAQLIKKDHVKKFEKDIVQGGALVQSVNCVGDLGEVFQFVGGNENGNKNDINTPLLFKNPTLFPSSPVINNHNHVIQSQLDGLQRSKDFDLFYCLQQSKSDEFRDHIDLPVRSSVDINPDEEHSNTEEYSDRKHDLYSSLSRAIDYRKGNSNCNPTKEQLLIQNISLQVETFTRPPAGYMANFSHTLARLPYKYTHLSFIYPLDLINATSTAHRNEVFNSFYLTLEGLFRTVYYQPYPIFLVMSIDDHKMTIDELNKIEPFQIKAFKTDLEHIGRENVSNEQLNPIVYNTKGNADAKIKDTSKRNIIEPHNERYSIEFHDIRDRLLANVDELLKKYPKWYVWKQVLEAFEDEARNFVQYRAPLSVKESDYDTYMKDTPHKGNGGDLKSNERKNEFVSKITDIAQKNHSNVIYTIICHETNLPKVWDFMSQLGLLHRLQLMALAENNYD